MRPTLLLVIPQRRAVRLVSALLASLALLAVLTSCSSSKGGRSYKTITCGDFAKLANADDAITNGSLDIANAYLDASPVDAVGGADDVAAFGDQIVSSCDTATPDTKIITLKARVLSVFLAKHPADRP